MDGGWKEEERRRRRRVSDAARKRGARKWLNYCSRPPPAFNRRELDEFERELADRRRRRASSGSSAAGSSSAGASSSRASSSQLTPVKRKPEELGPLAGAEADPPRRGVIGPEDYLPPGQEEHFHRVMMERSAREEEELEARRRREEEIDGIFLEQGVAASQAQASREEELRAMKSHQAKVWIDLDSSDED